MPTMRTPCCSANLEALGQKGPGDNEWGLNKTTPLPACQEMLLGWRERKTVQGVLEMTHANPFDSKRETEAGEEKAAAQVVPLMTLVPASALAMPLPFSLPATTDQAPTVGCSVGTLGLMNLLFTPREFIAKREETRK